jgi:hypothetical protein
MIDERIHVDPETGYVALGTSGKGVEVGSVSSCHCVPMEPMTNHLTFPKDDHTDLVWLSRGDNGYMGIGISETLIMFGEGQNPNDCPHWTHLKIEDKWYERARVKIDGAKVCCTSVTISYLETPASTELNLLLASWRERGLDEQADAVERYDDDGGDIWERIKERVEVENSICYINPTCSFYDRRIQSPSARLDVGRCGNAGPGTSNPCAQLHIVGNVDPLGNTDPGMKLDIGPHPELWIGN